MGVSAADSPTPVEIETRSHTLRDGLACALVFAVCLWTAWPVVEMGFDDDWSYIRTAQLFAQTGHFVYNGWAAAILGWQIVWGALFIKCFGFSFTVTRLSILPVDLATILLFHAILVRFGITPRNAVVGTLTLALSPLFLPLAASFMTDVPGLFVILLCLYGCQRALAAGTSKSTLLWLCLAAASNLVGGTVRQIAWLGALVMVPSAGWLLRKRSGVVPTVMFLWVICAGGIFACMRWFARQPYSLPESFSKGVVSDHGVAFFELCIELLGVALCVLLLAYPILAAWTPTIKMPPRAAFLRMASILLIWAVFQWSTRWSAPWLRNILDAEFASRGTDLWLPPPPLILPLWVRDAISLLVIATALAFIEYHKIWSLLENKTVRDLRLRLKNESDQITEWREIGWLLGLFTLSYCVLLLPRAYSVVVLDRYLLPILPIVILCLLKIHQQWVAETLPVVSVLVLSIFALLTICGTHDWFAWSRARLAAIDEIRASGVPRIQIQGGFEYDGWTQIEANGYINWPWIEVPAGAYHPYTQGPHIPSECQFGFAPYTPSIYPRFTIVPAPRGCLAPTNYPPIHYRTWLPPYNRTILVQKIPGSVP